ncbi:MAG: Smr/MutS family protein [Chitinispirillia bacterium]|jgi:DNA-nicking Smr family endonuclease
MGKKNDKDLRKNENEIIDFIDKHGIFNKDIDNHNVKPDKSNISKRKKGTKVLTVDLHGKTKNEARVVLHRVFETGISKGYSKLLIIHGKGNNSDKKYGPVIKKLVYSMLKNEFYNSLIDFRTAAPEYGGEGATIVVLK